AFAWLKHSRIGSPSWWRRDVHHDRGRRGRRGGRARVQPPGLAAAAGDGGSRRDGLKVWELTPPIASLAVVLLVFVLVQTYAAGRRQARASSRETASGPPPVRTASARRGPRSPTRWTGSCSPPSSSCSPCSAPPPRSTRAST